MTPVQTTALASQAIAIRRVVQRYRTPVGDMIALRCPLLDVATGEWVAVTGPSGAGKTTLLHLIAGLASPTEGDLLVFGVRPATLGPAALEAWRANTVGIAFQDPGLFPSFSAIENTVLSRVHRERTAQLYPRAARLLDELGLATRLDQPAYSLSRGEQQRVNLGRALLGAPKLLLVDEPTGNLDAAAGRQLLNLLRKVKDAHNVTILMATHDAATARQADRELALTPA